MFGYAGPLPSAILAHTLWLLVAPLLLGLAGHVTLACRRRRKRNAGDAAPHEARLLEGERGLGVLMVVLATVATAAHVVVLARRKPIGGFAILEYASQGVRIGRFDASAGLWFDPIAAAGCSFACVLALAAIVLLARRPPVDGVRSWAWIELALAGALLSFLADGIVTMALGWTLSAAAGAWLAGWAHARSGVLAGTRSGVALALLWVGTSLLFWGLGGTWRGDEYLGDPSPDFAAVRVGPWGDAAEHERAGAAGTLTLTSAPGAELDFDDGRSPVLTSPFVDAPFLPGEHSVRVRPGAATNDDRVAPDPVSSAPLALVRFGPTTSFRELAQLAVVRDREGETALAHLLRGRPAPWATDIASSVLAL